MSLVKVTSIQRNGKDFAKDLLVDLSRITEPVFENIGGNAVIVLNETSAPNDHVNRGNNNVQYILTVSLADFIILSTINVFPGTVVSRDGRPPVVSSVVFFAEKIVGRIIEDPLGSTFLYDETGGDSPIEYVVSETIAAISLAILLAASYALPYKVYSALLTEVIPATIVAGPLTIGETYTITDYMGGIADTISLVDAGTGYATAVGVAVLGGTGLGMTVDVTETGGVIDTVIINNPGEGYVATDLVSVDAGDGLGTFTVDTVLSDDFTNVGAALNQDAEVFVATGTAPTDYTNGSTLDSAGSPIATILTNTLSALIVWTRDSAGEYTGTLAGEFTLNKTTSTIDLIGGGNTATAEPLNINEINIETFNEYDVLTDALLSNTLVEIRVYN